MKIVFLTQDDPFYLPTIYDYLIPKLIEDGNHLVATVLFQVAPFGKKKSKFEQLLEIVEIFGLAFAVHYSWKYLISLFSNDVSSVMENYDIPILRLSKSVNHIESINLIKEYKPDLLISLAGNEIFKSSIRELATYGVINLHSALLPKYRGLMPSFWVLHNLEKVTGVSVFFVDNGIDSGPIIVQKEVPILEQTQEKLIWELKFRGADAIIEACRLINKNGIDIEVIENQDDHMTYYSKPTKEDVRTFLRRGNSFY